MELITVKGTTISDIWFQLLYNLFDNSYEQRIQQGSFIGERRYQYPGVAIYISHPFVDMIPTIPDGLGIPNPSTMEYVTDYFTKYIMDPVLEENETYKYASRIHSEMPNGGTQFSKVIEMLNKTPFTNQAVLEIGTPVDLDICVGSDGNIEPPCLRSLTFNVHPPDILTVTSFWRSWALYSALPVNLAGLELLKQYVAEETGLRNGCMYAYSSGLHIYGYEKEMSEIRAYKRDK